MVSIALRLAPARYFEHVNRLDDKFRAIILLMLAGYDGLDIEFSDGTETSSATTAIKITRFGGNSFGISAKLDLSNSMVELVQTGNGEVENLRSVCIADLFAGPIDEPNVFRSVMGPLDEIWSFMKSILLADLREGRIVSLSGVPRKSREREEIKLGVLCQNYELIWSSDTLVIEGNERNRISEKHDSSMQMECDIWEDVKIKFNAGDLSVSSHVLKKKVEDSCKDRLLEIMRHNPCDPPPKAVVFDSVVIRIPGLTRAIFDRAWDRATSEMRSKVPTTRWGRGGRPNS